VWMGAILQATKIFQFAITAGLVLLFVVGLQVGRADATTQLDRNIELVQGDDGLASWGGVLADGELVIGRSAADGFEVDIVSASGSAATIARLSLDGVETRSWVGYLCTTGSGRYVAVAFAPAEAIDDAELRNGGALLAVIDLVDRKIVVADQLVALKYHSPGCGPVDEVSAVRHLVDGNGDVVTDVLSVNPDSGTTSSTALSGQHIAPAPFGDAVYVASGNQVLRVSDSGAIVAADSEGRFVDLHANELGGIDYLEIADSGELSAIEGAEFGAGTVVATGALGDLGWYSGRGGRNSLIQVSSASAASADGITDGQGRLPDVVSLSGDVTGTLTALPSVVSASEIGSAGDVSLAVEVQSADGEISVVERTPGDVMLTVASQVEFVAPAVDEKPVCAVPPNDPSIQVLQPSPRQVEWAVHKAVRGELDGGSARKLAVERTEFIRSTGRVPAGAVGDRWAHSCAGLTWDLGQESNLWQASGRALPGLSSNPLIGNYFGVKIEDGRVVSASYSLADCGYGVGQITDNMRLDDDHYTDAQKLMIATDYASNIAVAQQILAEKWNQLEGLGMIDADTDPSIVENWYMPVWAYNSGLATVGDPTGLGWTNNPANSDWRFDRRYYLRDGLDDARTPADWPYQERVLGYAETGLYLRGDLAFSPIIGSLNLPRFPSGAVSRFEFCVPGFNSCSQFYTSPRPYATRFDRSYCTRGDRKCWWNRPLPFDLSLGGTPENAAPYSSGPEPAVSSPYPVACTFADAILPEVTEIDSQAALIVDDVPSSVDAVAECNSLDSVGSFELTYGSPMAESDMGQFASGLDGHFYSTRTNWAARGTHTVTGTWRPPASARGWHRILVMVPTVGADTYQADYRIYDGTESGETSRFHRVVNQRWNDNRWVDLGVFPLSAGARVELSNVTATDHSNNADDELNKGKAVSISWDAMAFVPVDSRPDVAYVSIGDSYSSGEGGSNYYANSDATDNASNERNACHRSLSAYGPRAYADLATSESLGRSPQTTTFAFLACSGALVEDLLESFHWGEVPQLAQGWIDENTTHVSVGIGGNNAKFSTVLKKCLTGTLPSTNCNTTTLEGDTEPANVVTPRRIDDLRESYEDVIGKIREAAPRARITLVGYPKIIQTDPEKKYNLASCNLLGPEDPAWMEDMVDRLNGVIRDAANAAANVEYADIKPAYSGVEACTRPEYRPEGVHINAISVQTCGACGLSGEGRDVAIAGSFHPTDVGHGAALGPVLDALKRSSGFACYVDAGTLSWNDPGQAVYWMYKSTEDGASYQWLGRTLGDTTYTDPSPTVGARYQVHYAGIPRTNCETTAEPPDEPAFTCSANAGVITWTDAQQEKYWVYKSTDDGANYNWLGRTTGATTITDPDYGDGDRYQVHYQGLPRQNCE